MRVEGPTQRRNVAKIDPFEPLVDATMHVRETRVDSARSRLIQMADAGKTEVGTHVGDQQPVSAQQSRMGWHQYIFHAKFAGERGSQQRARPAERDQREASRVESLFNRDDAYGLDQVLVQNSEYALGSLLQIGLFLAGAVIWRR